MNSTRLTPEYLAEDNSAPLLGTCITFLVLETIVITLLHVSRYFGRGERANMSMEILMTLTYIVCVSKITNAILMIRIGGAGRHLRALPRPTITNALKLNLVSQIVCPLTTSLSKLGVLCLFHRIFGQASKAYRMVIKTTFGLVLVIVVVQVLIPFVNCRPFSRNWNPNGPGSCAILGLSLWRYLSIPNVFTTFIVVLIPVPALAKLKVSRAMKAGLAVIFGVCIIGVVAAIMRLQAFLRVTNFSDITYENVRPMCWTIAESGIYLVAGVMTTLKPLLKKLFKGTRFERVLTGNSKSRQSGSWGNKRFSRMWLRGAEPVPMVMKEHRSHSDASGDGVSLVRAELLK
ncbi:hypothetical protein BKA66DRAFT_278843 [Pyrenochaeta sp. MPI-SDFR-AT-0127]|nr:hypothetical protein BKA66DRAFT_278843 [Pyrenochaeta sp. MPI-SDFR-AT-0127]